ncbi:MAG: alpha/beta fold hydrolase [Myxococcota bacterium]
MTTVEQEIERHRGAGRMLSVDGVSMFVRDEGTGPPVVCMHGVPVSSYVYRHVLSGLSTRGLRGIAFDYPGLGLSDRPRDYDYRWTNLGRMSTLAIDALGCEKFHLVVHDIGGPVGFEIATTVPERILSLTILNTLVNVASFSRPWSMQPFAVPGLGYLWLKSAVPPVFAQLFYLQGFHRSVPPVVPKTHHRLLVREDGGRAFLKIMQRFELTAEKERL